MQDVVIIGAGVIGCMLAYKLSHYELSVTLVEAQHDVSMGATKANSAIIHGGYAESSSLLKGKLCYPGRRQLYEIVEALEVPHQRLPSLVLSDQAQDPILEELYENGLRNGLDDLSILNEKTLYQREPHLREGYRSALLCEGAGIVSPYELCISLADHAVHNDVQLRLNFSVVGVDALEDGFRVISEQGDAINGRYVINASGLSAASIARYFGIDDYTIKPRSGEYILLRPGQQTRPQHTLFGLPTALGKGVLVSTTVDGMLILGPDAVQDETPNYDTHLDRLGAIWVSAHHVRKDLDATTFLRSFAGVRAVSSTDDWVIRSHGRYLEAAGIQSPGLTASPAIADRVIELLGLEGVELRPKSTYACLSPIRRVEAKLRLSPEELTRRTALPVGDPERIVCRCEQVEEAKIVEALSRPVPCVSVDGVKRRTRAGMGACQGGFCRERVASYLSDPNPHRPSPIVRDEDITHSGISRVGRAEAVKVLRALSEAFEADRP